jgi:hypothetical protein
MANCSIPNSSPASGRISTRSSRPSRRRNNPAAVFDALRGTEVVESNLHKRFNSQRSTLNAQRPIQKIGRSMLDVGCCEFSFLRRVKGAWWPSRSSKPSSPRKCRGRFDSYPLRLFFTIPCSRFAVRNVRVVHRAAATAARPKGGDITCRVSRSGS